MDEKDERLIYERRVKMILVTHAVLTLVKFMCTNAWNVILDCMMVYLLVVGLMSDNYCNLFTYIQKCFLQLGWLLTMGLFSLQTRKKFALVLVEHYLDV